MLGAMAQITRAPGARPELPQPARVLDGACYQATADPPRETPQAPLHGDPGHAARWLAIVTRVGGEAMAVTVEMKAGFLRGAATDLASRAAVLRPGRRIVFGDARTTATDGSPAAHFTLSHVRPVSD